jgi:hypothetical protein
VRPNAVPSYRVPVHNGSFLFLSDNSKWGGTLVGSSPGAANLVRGNKLDLELALKLPDTLQRSLTTTNAAESLISRTRHVKRNVKRWRGQMVVRWVAAGVLEAVKGFRRLKGHKAISTSMENVFLNLGTALGLGLLVGWQRERAHSHMAGVRTFPLITVLGTMCGLLAERFGGWIVAAGLLGIAALALMSNIVRVHGDEAQDPGQTTEAAALLMFSVGAFLVALALSWCSGLAARPSLLVARWRCCFI